jgi:uncharacterized protein (DUF2267 family)
MNENFEKTAQQAAAFQKIWMESMSKLMQTAFTITPNSPPPEILRQIRSGIFQALAQSWEEFMRSPQFLEGMKQWMESAINFRKMTNDFMAKIRNEMQAPSRDDIDTVMLSVRHMEKRLLDRVEELSEQVTQLNQRVGGAGRRTAAKTGRTRRRRVAGNGKVETH